VSSTVERVVATVPKHDPETAFHRRARAAGLDIDHEMTHGPFALNLSRYELTNAGNVIELSALQLETLAVFFAAPDRVWSRRDVNALTDGKPSDSRRVDVRLARLRMALRTDLFRAIAGRGWILRAADHLKTR
jgi:DNA-binding response OmpR family regulator